MGDANTKVGRSPTRRVAGAEQALEAVVDEIFAPDREQQAAKAAFWANAAEDVTFDRQSITLESAYQVLPDSRIRRWWSLPGFREWFCNASEWQQKVQHGADIALETLISVMEDPKAAPNARVRAAEIVARLADKEPAKVREVKWADQQIQKLEDPAQVQRFIVQQAPLILRILSEAGKLPDGTSSE